MYDYQSAVRCGSKNGYRKDEYFNEVKLNAQNLSTILESTVNTAIGRTYVNIYGKRDSSRW